MSESNGVSVEAPPSIEVNNLTFAFPDGSTGLQDIILNLPPGSRTLLIGANGAGKTTLLRLLSGRRLSPPNTISISGTDPFTNSLQGCTYLGLEWVLNPIVRTDIAVPELLASVGGNAYPERKEELVSILDIDLAWRMHTVSDGERRRVQLAMGLLRPWRVLLLDEITVDLDLLTRWRFLMWLKSESEARGCTIMYATHILDNLSGWPSHLVHMHLGRVKQQGTVESFDIGAVPKSGNSQLSELVLEWLKDDLEERGPRNGAMSEGKTYENLEGRGGYGNEKRPQ